MSITSIAAGRSALRLYTDVKDDVPLTVYEYVPTVGAKAGRMLSVTPCTAKAGVITLPRFAAAHDRLYSRYAVYADGAPLAGVCHVTDVDPDVPENTAPYPQPPTIKAFDGAPDVLRRLDIRQCLLNINLLNLMTTQPTPQDIPHRFNGRTYYFRAEAVQHVDAHMLAVPMTTMILLNAPRSFGATGEKPLLDACIHPAFDWDDPGAYLSAFDMETEEGQGFFGAFVDFLAQRYTRPDGKYGRAVGAIISNEVNSQYVWSNAGEMPLAQYAAEYVEALRLAWLCGQSRCAHFRVYASLDQFWYGAGFDPAQPLRYYPSRPLLEALAARCAQEGDFGWNVAYHPYPEDLRYPDFWNDRAPNFTLTTPKITFKNMEVLQAFLAQEPLLYRGAPRRIIFSEQGFNSQDGPLQAFTEQQAAAGYVLAYMKARKMPTVDMLTDLAFMDTPDFYEMFGLNLGVFRYDPAAPDHRGEAKPIYASLAAMDTPDEPAAVERARAFIGPALFDYLLDAPPVGAGA